MFFAAEVQYLAAIGAGLLAQFAASAMPLTQASDNVWYGGAITPFDVSLIFLVVAIPAISSLWQAGAKPEQDGTCNAASVRKIMESLLMKMMETRLCRGLAPVLLFFAVPGLAFPCCHASDQQEDSPKLRPPSRHRALLTLLPCEGYMRVHWPWAACGLLAEAGWRALSSSYDVPILGLAVAAFESSMHPHQLSPSWCCFG